MKKKSKMILVRGGGGRECEERGELVLNIKEGIKVIKGQTKKGIDKNQSVIYTPPPIHPPAPSPAPAQIPG